MIHRSLHKKAGTLELTLFLLGLIRLMLPKVLLPATTALGTIAPNGRELGILSGANVVMPNLSPKQVRGDYLLYDNKISTDAEAAECRAELEQRMQSIGYQVITDRGDSLKHHPLNNFLFFIFTIWRNDLCMMYIQNMRMILSITKRF